MSGDLKFNKVVLPKVSSMPRPPDHRTNALRIREQTQMPKPNFSKVFQIQPIVSNASLLSREEEALVLLRYLWIRSY